MNTVFRAVILFMLLAVLALLLGTVGQAPLPVAVQIGTLTLTTSAPIAIVAVLAAFMLAFYLGRLTGWMIRLPRSWFRRKQAEAFTKITDAHAALAMGNPTLARQLVDNLKPDDTTQADLIQLVSLQSPPLPPLNEKNLANPRLAALTALTYAQAAANAFDWEETLRLATLGRQFAPENAHLLTLQFKAMVNLGNPRVTELLPALKPLLGPTRHKLLATVITGPNTLTARPTLDNTWVKSFEKWLPTGSAVFPE